MASSIDFEQKKFQRTVQTFLSFERHIFSKKHSGVANFKGKLSTTCWVDYTYEIKFGRIIIDKSPKNCQQIRKLTFSKNINVCLKKIGRNRLCR